MALRLARKFISLLPPDGVPVWDFRLTPDSPPLLNSSAAAVAVCGLLKLLKVRPVEAGFAATVEAAEIIPLPAR